MGRRLRTSLWLQLREYRSRLVPLVMLAMLPLLFWAGTFFSIDPNAKAVSTEVLAPYETAVGPLVVAEVPERDTWPMDTAFMGVGWGLAAAALFSIIGSGARDRRLILAGYRAWEILLARLVILLLLAVPISGIPVLVTALFSAMTPPHLGLVWLGCYFAAVVGAGIGLIVGSLLPRQLEGTILLIGIIGTEISIPFDVTLRHYLPLYGPQALFVAGRFAADPIVLAHVLRGLAWGAGLTAIATALWTWRVRVYRQPEPTIEPAAYQPRTRTP